MNARAIFGLRRALLATAVALCAATGVLAQAPVDLTRTDIYYADPGRPNIAGFWRRQPGAVFWVNGKPLPAPDADGHQADLPYKPAWQEVVAARYAADLRGEKYGDPTDACWPAGVFADYMTQPAALKITQTPGRIQLLFERQWTKRLIFTNRRHLEGDYLTPTLKGDSVGRWDGKALVADTIGVRPEVTLGFRLPHSDKAHFVERFQRTAPDTLKIDVTITDPVALLRPVQARLTYKLDPQGEFVEDFCMDHNDVIIDANLVVHPDARDRKRYGFDLPK